MTETLDKVQWQKRTRKQYACIHYIYIYIDYVYKYVSGTLLWRRAARSFLVILSRIIFKCETGAVYLSPYHTWRWSKRGHGYKLYIDIAWILYCAVCFCTGRRPDSRVNDPIFRSLFSWCSLRSDNFEKIVSKKVPHGYPVSALYTGETNGTVVGLSVRQSNAYLITGPNTGSSQQRDLLSAATLSHQLSSVSLFHCCYCLHVTLTRHSSPHLCSQACGFSVFNILFIISYIFISFKQITICYCNKNIFKVLSLIGFVVIVEQCMTMAENFSNENKNIQQTT